MKINGMEIITESKAIKDFLKEEQDDIDAGYANEDTWGTTQGKCHYCRKPVKYPLVFEYGGVITRINHADNASPPLKFWCIKHFLTIRAKLKTEEIPNKFPKNLLNFFKTKKGELQDAQ